jgi:hypothetical protein
LVGNSLFLVAAGQCEQRRRHTMRKLLLPALVAAVALAVGTGAGLASAQGGRHHHHSSPQTHKHRSHVRVVHIGEAGSTGSTGATGATTPPMTAGTVVSFTNGVLTIKLNDGTMTSGQVSQDTQIDCASAVSPSEDQGDDDQGDDDQGDGGGNQTSFGGRGDDEGQGGMACAAIMAGTGVIAADLRISPTGSFWERVLLAS